MVISTEGSPSANQEMMYYGEELHKMGMASVEQYGTALSRADRDDVTEVLALLHDHVTYFMQNASTLSQRERREALDNYTQVARDAEQTLGTKLNW